MLPRCCRRRVAASRKSGCTANRTSRPRSGFSAASAFDEGVAGHITARDPELTDHFWVNPFGMHFGHIRVSDLLLVRHDGEIAHGNLPLNQAAFAIHS